MDTTKLQSHLRRIAHEIDTDPTWHDEIEDGAVAYAMNTAAAALEAHAAQLAELRQALRAYDLAGPLTECRRQALGTILTMARQLTEE